MLLIVIANIMEASPTNLGNEERITDTTRITMTSLHNQLRLSEGVNSMGTYASCLVALVHNLEDFIKWCGEKIPSDMQEVWAGLTTNAYRLDLLWGRYVWFKGDYRMLQESIISKNLARFLRSCIETRNCGVHETQSLYNSIDRAERLVVQVVPPSKAPSAPVTFFIISDVPSSVLVTSGAITKSAIDPADGAHAPVQNAKGLEWTTIPYPSQKDTVFMEPCREEDAVVILRLWTRAGYKENKIGETLHKDAYGALVMTIGKHVCVYATKEALYRQLQQRVFGSRMESPTRTYKFRIDCLFHHLVRTQSQSADKRRAGDDNNNAGKRRSTTDDDDE